MEQTKVQFETRISIVVETWDGLFRAMQEVRAAHWNGGGPPLGAYRWAFPMRQYLRFIQLEREHRTPGESSKIYEQSPETLFGLPTTLGRTGGDVTLSASVQTWDAQTESTEAQRMERRWAGEYGRTG